MSCEVNLNRLYCTTSETEFGPVLRDGTEGFELIAHVHRTRGVDPRAIPRAELELALAELRSGTAEQIPTHHSAACFCGSGRPWMTKTHWKGFVTTKCMVCRQDTPRAEGMA